MRTAVSCFALGVLAIACGHAATGAPSPAPAQCNDCTPRGFVKGAVSPQAVVPGGAYTVVCDYGDPTDSVDVSTGSGRCVRRDSDGTEARFDCVAGAAPGDFALSCVLSTISPDHLCGRSDPIGALAVTRGGAEPPPGDRPAPAPSERRSARR